MAAFTSIALGIAAAAAVAGTASTVVQGERAARQQRYGLRRQEAAQAQAKQNALSQQVRAEMAQNAMSKKAPDINAILAFEQSATGSIPGRGPRVDRSQLKLGQPSLLGDA